MTAKPAKGPGADMAAPTLPADMWKAAEEELRLPLLLLAIAIRREEPAAAAAVGTGAAEAPARPRPFPSSDSLGSLPKNCEIAEEAEESSEAGGHSRPRQEGVPRRVRPPDSARLLSLQRRVLSTCQDIC